VEFPSSDVSRAIPEMRSQVYQHPVSNFLRAFGSLDFLFQIFLDILCLNKC
jgi:hypothetical protein